jgi:3-oxoacyl-[acyl-carrier-protein] synthase II
MKMIHNGTRVVVTGMGVISPVGLTVADAWHSLVSGKSGIDYITRFDTTSFDTKFAGEAKGFEASAYVGSKAVRHMDRFTQFAVAASMEAAADARLAINGNNADETGVIIGNSVCGLLGVCEQIEVMNEAGPGRISPILAPKMTGDAACVQVSLLLGSKGPSYSVSSACSSGADAIGHAYDLVRHGEAKVMIAGGTEAPIGPVPVAAFNACRALSTKNSDPKRACRPFDVERDGFVLGEGAAVMVIEELGYALERGAHVLAEIVGYSATSDAFHIMQPSPDGRGAVRTMELALKKAGLGPADIDYINAHGSATVLNDKTETLAIKKVFGQEAYRIPISATKSMTGHLLGAAGALEAIVCVLAINHGVVPPTINLDNPDPECDLDYVPNVGRPIEVETAMSNSFGFGGHNSVLIFRRYRG